jgi:hypothetical protein
VGRARVAQRVSYKALDVEQIGHCYEGLLDHGCTPVDVLAVGLVGPEGAEPEFAITDLERRLATGPEPLLDWLAEKARCNKSAPALAQLLARQPTGVDVARLRVACGHDDNTVARVLPFWGLLRTDLRNLPVVLLPGSLYVTQTSTRRNTGAQYTTKTLAEEVARYALEPLVYEPGPQNEADPQHWRLRVPGDILGLRICDPAVGSGAILTAAGRYLADRLVEAVIEHGPGAGPFAGRLADLAAAPSEEQTLLARREVVDHCLYGVDKNPVAAEMAKLSLWLTSMARERPFTFLDHAIQVGDSLLGLTDMEQLRWLHLDPAERMGAARFETLALDVRLNEATDLARRLQDLSVVTVRDASEKQRLHDELRSKLADLAIVADTVVGAALNAATSRGVSTEQRLESQMERIRVALDDDRPEIERAAALNILHSVSTGWLRTDLPDVIPMPWDRQCLHWPLAFPEVFLDQGRKGFDAIVANPPFLGDAFLNSTVGSGYREHLVKQIAGMRGRSDLCGFFLLRFASLGLFFGSLATNSICQGDTRAVSLDQLDERGWTIFRAWKSVPWPNEATLEISKVWLSAADWLGAFVLDDSTVAAISTLLDPPRRTIGPPHRLLAGAGCSFLGSYIGGQGFLMTPAEAGDILASHPECARVLKRYLNGKDLNDSPTQSGSRFAIDFGDMTEDLAAEYKPLFALVEEEVKPERTRRKSDGTYQLRAPLPQRWWQYGDKRPALYRAVQSKNRVLAIALTSKTVMPAFQPTNQVFSHATGVFVYDDDAHFGLLSSSLHWWWAVTYASTMRTDLRYTPSDVFETFPQPEPQRGPRWETIDTAGRILNEFRENLMIRTQLGLTKTYNRVHDPAVHDADIARLRELHTELDYAVRDGYGWSELPLDHHHWETPQGMRFTISPPAKDELLDRLLELNHARYAAEVASGLHGKKGKKATAKRAPMTGPGQEAML